VSTVDEDINELVEDLEKEAEYGEKFYKIHVIIDPKVLKALAKILKMVKEIHDWLEDIKTVPAEAVVSMLSEDEGEE